MGLALLARQRRAEPQDRPIGAVAPLGLARRAGVELAQEALVHAFEQALGSAEAQQRLGVVSIADRPQLVRRCLVAVLDQGDSANVDLGLLGHPLGCPWEVDLKAPCAVVEIGGSRFGWGRSGVDQWWVFQGSGSFGFGGGLTTSEQ